MIPVGGVGLSDGGMLEGICVGTRSKGKKNHDALLFLIRILRPQLVSKLIRIKNQLLYLERKPHQPSLVFMPVHYPGRIGIWRTQRKTLGTRTRTNNKRNPHMKRGRNSTRAKHWLEASALTTAPSLLPLSWAGAEK